MKRFMTLATLLLGSIGLLRAEGLSREEVQALRKQGAVVIDVRTPEEYKAGHLQGTTNVPLAEIASRISQVSPDTNQPVLLHCRSGGRSARAKDVLVKAGYQNVKNLGGLEEARKLLAPPNK
jgi:phage shock protein E